MTPARKTIEVTGVFDIETQDWSIYVLGALLVGGTYLEYDWRREEELVDRILTIDGTLWAHNGGKYDTLWLLSHIARREIPAQVWCAGQRIVNLKVGKLQVRDSAALIPMTLEKGALLGGQQKAKTELPCRCGEDCGGYCSIRRGMASCDLRRLSEYLRQDCHATREMLRALVSYAEKEDIDLTGTIGSSAWCTAQRLYELPKAKWAAKLYQFANQAKHGGRVQVFRPYADHGHRYDINSSYPAALKRTALPTGEMSYHDSPAEASKLFEQEKEGIYQASVSVPDLFVPPLPVRFPKRVGYPIGNFTGTWTRIELVYALGRGARIANLHRALVWERADRVFEPFIDKLMKLRWQAIEEASRDPRFRENPKKHSLAEWLKLLANSAIGKLGQNPETDNVKVNPDEVTSCPANGVCAGVPSPWCGLNGCCRHKCLGTCKRWTCLDRRGAQKIWTYETYRIADCAHVHWSAYGLSAARIELSEELCADGQGGESAIYCDTDSCYATKPRVRQLGSSLGQWAYEGNFRAFLALAPKVYRYRDPARGREVVRAKGIPDAGQHWDTLQKGKPVEIARGVMSFRSAARASHSLDQLFIRKQTSRHLEVQTRTYGDRWAMGPMTFPLEAEKVRALP